MKYTVPTNEIVEDVVLTPVYRTGLNYDNIENAVIHCSYQFIRTKSKADNCSSKNNFCAYILATKIYMYPQTDDLRFSLENKLFKKISRVEDEERVYHIRYTNEQADSLEFPFIDKLIDEETQITLSDDEYRLLTDKSKTSLYDFITFKSQSN